MEKIYILGFGCGERGQITLDTLDILKKSDRVYVRTVKHPACVILDEFNIPYTSFDDLYELNATFEDVYEKISDTVLNSDGEIISYIVPGSPVFAEKAVTLITQNAECEVCYVPSVSFIDGVFSAMKTDGVEGFKLIDALNIASSHPDLLAINVVCQVYDRSVASDVKLELMRYYDDETNVLLIIAASSENEKIIPCHLYEIDRFPEIDHLTTLILPKQDYLSANKSFDAFIKVIEVSRSEQGCPWDREQTHETLTRYLIEESYEYIDAIKRNDTDNMCEELGDILLQVVLHAQIAKEEGTFDINDVIGNVSKKMIRRHPHVFADKELSKDLLVQWEELKNTEHVYSSISEKMNNIPKSFPPLLYAEKVQKKAANVGFDFDDNLSALKKLEEEIGEFCEALAIGKREAIESEAGDVLFAAVNVLRLSEIDPSEALKKTCERFIERFSMMEKLSEEQIGLLSKIKQNELWEQAKKKLI